MKNLLKFIFLITIYAFGDSSFPMENLDDNKRMGLEIETRKIKVHNSTTQNLIFFKVGNPPYWEFTSDTLDKHFDKTKELEKNIANVEARTILGQKKIIS